jgi:hypothetical protein
MTKCHRLGGLNDRIYVFTFLKVGDQGVGRVSFFHPSLSGCLLMTSHVFPNLSASGSERTPVILDHGPPK